MKGSRRRLACRLLGAAAAFWLLSGGSCGSDPVDPGQNDQAPSAAADAFETDQSSSLSVPAGTGLLANDDTGTPAAAVESFGGGSLGGSVADHAAGSTVSPLPSEADGSLTVSADGSVAFTPPSGFQGALDFEYRLANTAGTSDGAVTITVTVAPSAAADSYQSAGDATLDVTDGPDDLLANDALGFPEAALATFGGGSLGGTVADHAAGSTVTPLPSHVDGSLVVRADGTFTLDPPTGFQGTFSFEYEISSSSGNSPATVDVILTGAPGAQPDVYGTPFNTTLTVPDGTGDLLDNDAPGVPAGTLTSFGGGSLGGSVTDQAAGATVSPLPGEADGLLTVGAGGSVVFTPATGYSGTFTFQYRAENAIGSSDALVAIDVEAPPSATDDPYPQTVIGNVRIVSAQIPFSVTDNDNFDSPVTITAFDAVSAQGGDVTMVASGVNVGRFTYDPPPGFEGSDSFDYTIENASGSSTGTVDLAVAGMIWFIDNNAPGGGDGRLSSPFSSLFAFDAVNDGGAGHPEAGDNAFVYESATAYTGPVDLLPDQRFIGQDGTTALATLAGVSVPSGSTPLPVMDAANGTRVLVQGLAGLRLPIDVASSIAIHGLTVGNTGSFAGIAGSFFGALTVRDVDITDGGPAVDLDNGTVDATFGELTSTSSPGSSIELTTVSGTLSDSDPASTLTNYSSAGVLISSGTIDFTYGGDISNATFGPVQAQALAGTQTFTGDITSQGSGINVGGSATVVFSGTLTLNTGGSQGFTANGGTVEVTGPGSTITTTTGRAVDINTTIGPAGVTFESVSADGAFHGIRLRNTGSLGSFTVTGDGPSDPNDTTRGRSTAGGIAPGSGGTITNTTAAGVYLENATGVTLMNMVIGDPTADRNETADATTFTVEAGIEARDVTDLVLDNVLIARTGEAGIEGIQTTVANDGLTLRHTEILNAGDDAIERGIELRRAVGTILIENSVIDAMVGDGIHLGSIDGTMDIVVRNTLVSDNDDAALCGGTCEGSGLSVFPDAFGVGQPSYTLLVEDSEFTGIDGTAILAHGSIPVGTPVTSDVTIRNTSIHSNPLGEPAAEIFPFGTTNDLLIDNLDISDHAGDLVLISAGRHLNATITASGGETNSWVGDSTGPPTAGVGLSLGVVGNSSDPDVTVLVENTDVTQVDDGLSISCSSNLSAAAVCDVTVRNSTFGRSGAALTGLPIRVSTLATYPARVLLDGLTLASSDGLLPALDVDAFQNSVLDVTMTDNDLTSAGGMHLGITTSSGLDPVMCSNVTGNMVTGGDIELQVSGMGGAGVHNVVQADAAAVSAANGGVAVTEIGSPMYGATACALPELPN